MFGKTCQKTTWGCRRYEIFLINLFRWYFFPIHFIFLKGYNTEFEKFAQNEIIETKKDESEISLNDAIDEVEDQDNKGMNF